MARATVQGLILERLTNIEGTMGELIKAVETLKVKSRLAGWIGGAVAGTIATGLMTFTLNYFKS